MLPGLGQNKISFKSFQTDAAKISYVIGLLRGRELKWTETKLGQQVHFQGTYDLFLSTFKQTFGYTESQSNITHKLWNVRLGCQAVADFAIYFRTLAASSGSTTGSETKPDPRKNCVFAQIKLNPILTLQIRAQRSLRK
ncbi:hypothetical protein CCH79_00015424 [Gambusia affinis]|uniref:DUF4939 domain-containing protein n=1 Tax=Gambusia affinis TaxID=33528 RepID=A0A315VHV5_GAMAF|nr:hypothetical protein CCH79_00015424 [Gambusia affinis]